VVATKGFPNPEEIVGMTFDFQEQAPYQDITRTRRPVILQDTLEVAGWQHTGPRPIRSWIGAPLLASDRLIGLLTVDHSQPDFYHWSEGEVVMAFANLAAIALENARLYQFEVKQIEQELSIARQIQRGFLPRHVPEIPGWQIAAVCLPARETGGDFYEFVERTDGALGLAVGDVSGKSVPAAMLMAAAQSMVGAKGSDHLSPAKVLNEVNMLLCDDIPRGTFVAMSYALLTPHQPTVHLSNGGQLAPFLVPAGERPIQLVETPAPRWPMGIMPESCYQETAIILEPGDLLVFYTDGLVERKNEKEELFGFERVGSALDEMRGLSPDHVLQHLLAAADSFAHGLSAHDDVTLVIVQRVPYN
jgi:serine phosphatase RsbU (regulator of sigma subunit)